MLGDRTSSGEADLVVDLTEVRRAASTRGTYAARDDALDDDRRAGGADTLEVVFEATDPFMTERQGVTDVRGVDGPVDEL